MGSFDIVGSVLRFCFGLFCFPYKINTQDQCVICLGTFGPGVCRWEGAAKEPGWRTWDLGTVSSGAQRLFALKPGWKAQRD